MSRRTRRPKLKGHFYLSLVLHTFAFLWLLVWGHSKGTVITPPVDIVMVEVAKGPSQEIGMGTQEDAPENSKISEEQKPEPVSKSPPPEVVEKKVEKAPTLSQVLEKVQKAAEQPKQKDQLTEPTKEKKKVVAKPTTPVKPVRQKTAAENMLSTLNKLEGSLSKTQQARGKNSPGWEGGTALKPTNTIPTNAVLMRYRSAVQVRIHGQWVKPGVLTELPPKQRPRAVIHVRINGSGNIVSKNWVKRSGNAFLDESVMRALGRASPLPSPPKEVIEMVLSQGFNIDFKP